MPFPFMHRAVELDYCMLIKCNVKSNENRLFIGCLIIDSRHSIYSILLTYHNILCGRYSLHLILEKNEGQGRWHYYYRLVASSSFLSFSTQKYLLCIILILAVVIQIEAKAMWAEVTQVTLGLAPLVLLVHSPFPPFPWHNDPGKQGRYEDLDWVSDNAWMDGGKSLKGWDYLLLQHSFAYMG